MSKLVKKKKDKGVGGGVWKIGFFFEKEAIVLKLIESYIHISFSKLSTALKLCQTVK